MKEYSSKDIRNVVLIGSAKSGKTTLSEAMLYEGKVIERRGTVEGKNTVSDNTEFEQTNQKSVYATPLYAEFMNNKINVIDAPGSDDFCGGALSAFKVCESAILLINAQQGVEVGSEIFARYAEQYNKHPQGSFRQEGGFHPVPCQPRPWIQRFHRRPQHEVLSLQGRERYP